MSDELAAHTVGPVDMAVIAFATNAPGAELAGALREAVATGAVRIIDLALVHTDASGAASFEELADGDAGHVLAGLEDEHEDLLSYEDLIAAAADLEPSSSALVVVF